MTWGLVWKGKVQKGKKGLPWKKQFSKHIKIKSCCTFFNIHFCTTCCKSHRCLGRVREGDVAEGWELGVSELSHLMQCIWVSVSYFLFPWSIFTKWMHWEVDQVSSLSDLAQFLWVYSSAMSEQHETLKDVFFSFTPQKQTLRTQSITFSKTIFANHSIPAFQTFLFPYLPFPFQ
jgi:hypothetical protein